MLKLRKRGTYIVLDDFGKEGEEPSKIENLECMESQLRICIITSPRPKAGTIPLSNLVDILSNLCSSLYLITGNEGEVVRREYEHIRGYSVTYRRRTLLPARIIGYISLQVRISYKLIKLIRKVDMFLFFMGEGLLLPVLVGRLLGKNVILSLGASLARMVETRSDPLSKAFKFLEALNYVLSNHIITYSPSLIKEWHLEKHGHKISIASEHFLEFDKFKIRKALTKRDNLVGYMGRLREEKGVLNFMEAIPKVLEKKDSVQMLIAGDGDLCAKVEQYLSERNLNDKARFIGWIPHDELPKYLNELKLLVLPSYTEGLPNTMLEAMACGTPVLATAVGAIPDVIEDGETGFIMEDNSPECIARNIIQALNHLQLEEIAQNARSLVEREFTYEKAAERYGSILTSLG